MPLLELICRAGALPSTARAEFVSNVGELLGRWNDLPKTNTFRFAPSLKIVELPASAMHEGVKPPDEATYLLSVATPAGSLITQGKADFLADVTKAFLTVDSGTPDANRVRIHIHEIPLGNWHIWQLADHVRRAAQPGTVHAFPL